MTDLSAEYHLSAQAGVLPSAPAEPTEVGARRTLSWILVSMTVLVGVIVPDAEIAAKWLKLNIAFNNLHHGKADRHFGSATRG
jgi:hypothetical protein